VAPHGELCVVRARESARAITGLRGVAAPIVAVYHFTYHIVQPQLLQPCVAAGLAIALSIIPASDISIVVILALLILRITVEPLR
jgi:hypothetical protein